MNVLLLTQVLPYPPDSGPKVKTWGVIKYLATDHSITLASFVRGDQSSDVKALRRYCASVHTVPMVRTVRQDALAFLRSVVSSEPWMMVRDDRAQMRDLVDRLSRSTRFDVVHADQLNMAQYALRVQGAERILDLHNALWVLYRRVAANTRIGLGRAVLERDWRLLKRYEGRMVQAFDHVLAVSDEDRDALVEAAGARSHITVIPIAVDTDEVGVVPRSPGARHVLHIGTMYWPPNIDGLTWFVRHVYPLIRAARPDVALDLVGARPPASFVALARRDPTISVPGYVEDVTPILARAGVFVVPLLAGGGMRVKILNALAQGLPIVSTSIGAEGIAVTPGVDILLADDAPSFAQAVVRVLDDAALAERLGAAARRTAVERYDYRVVCRLLGDIYGKAENQPAEERHATA